jgi:ankyrin repeat protein
MNTLLIRRAACLAWMSACCAAASAQSLSSGDRSEWSDFIPAVGEPGRTAVLDVAFADVRREGPWSRQSEAALGATEQALLDKLAQHRWADALAWLKQQQPDLNRRDESGVTPLSIAARAGQMELVREMIRQGADLDQIGQGGMTPLGAAAFNGHDIVVRDLVRKGARLNAPGVTGQLPLHLACAGGHTRVVSYLMGQGADWRWPNRQGRHALAEAAYFGQIRVMQQIKAAGADLAEPDLYRLNAVHAAAMGEQKAAIAWLQQQAVPVPGTLTQVLIDQVMAPPAALNN